ncbi:MAG: cadherin-like domain-containing protein [Halomonas sp.]|uniref:cadherin-like domain-containing protein n=1 Tax=Halomonas sp. TaxID=1486246 RepID=UPI002ACD3C0F|nr:cadherin-like domain-containing protein [Halomonas sp.]MDZ7852678.1 cadherin-like domain-containing protein [Halomonas sp.]
MTTRSFRSPKTRRPPATCWTPAQNPTGDGAVEVTTFAVDTNGDGTDESFNAGQTATIAGIGELTIAADGAYTFTPVADYNGPVPVATYSMSDDGGTTTGDTSTLTILRHAGR